MGSIFGVIRKYAYKYSQQDSRFQLGFQTICVGFQLVSGPPAHCNSPAVNI